MPGKITLAVAQQGPIQRSDSDEGIETNRISDLFLRQFDHFDLRDSEVSFITLSGQRAELAVAVGCR